MPHKYGAWLYKTSDTSKFRYLWHSTWFCREFAQRNIHDVVTQRRYSTTPLSLRIQGLNMRERTLDEQEGMAKFASLLLPNQFIDADSTSIWIESLMSEDGYNIYPPKEVYSLLFFYIKYLSVQMKDRVNFEKVCKSLIKRKHPVFQSIPDQQLGTALYFFSYVKYSKDMMHFNDLLTSGNGPGTAMRRLADLEEKAVGIPVKAAKFYWGVLDEWCSLFKKELRYMVDYHSKNYERLWYMPLLIQDVYAKIYDGDGKFDNMEYGDDEW